MSKISEHLKDADKSLQEAWKLLNDILYDRDISLTARRALGKRISELALQTRKLADFFKERE